jgi:Lrp/AsnC family leucine-responsive transcriptional regulator
MPKPDLDRIDFKILNELQRNARITNAQLAENVGLSPSPCLRRTKRLHDDGVIRQVLTIIAPDKVGLDIQAIVRIKLDGHGEEESSAFQDQVVQLREVLACFVVTGNTDVVLQLVAPDLPSYAKLIKVLGGFPQVKEIESSIIIETVKSWSPLPLQYST